jgi:hypothetical protein
MDEGGLTKEIYEADLGSNVVRRPRRTFDQIEQVLDRLSQEYWKPSEYE